MEVEENTENDGLASITDSPANLPVQVTSPDTSNSRNNLMSDESMSFLTQEPLFPTTLEPNVLGSLCRKRSDEQATHSDSSRHLTNLSGPSSSANPPGPSTSYSRCEIVDSSDNTEAQQIHRLFTNSESLRLLGSRPSEILTPIDAAISNSMNDTSNTIRVLCESLGGGNEDSNDFTGNTSSHLNMNPMNPLNNYGASNVEQSDPADQLFAPEVSTRDSAEHSCSYLKFLTSRQSSIDELPLLRTPCRYRRFLRPPFALNDLRDQASEIPVRLGSSQRLSPSLIHRSRLFRMRYSHADLFSRHKTTTALNAVSSNGSSANLTSGGESRELNARLSRRNFCLPKFNNESRFHTHVSPLECNINRYHRISRPERLINNRSPAYLQGLFEIENSLRTFSRPATSNVRARSVSPTSENPNVSASVLDEPLDDIAIHFGVDDTPVTAERFGSENHESQVQRPRTPLPPILSPTLSDDDITSMPLRSNNFEGVDISTASLLPDRELNNCQPTNLTISATDNCKAKEAPRTYEELNHELIQLLECPICFEYTTPPINQCLQGHIICNTCRQRVSTCPTCRTLFQESRNLIMEKVAALLRYPCRNAVTGCMEFLYLLQKENHEMACGFRQYACFLPLCNWRGYKPELLVHVQDTHENHVIHGPSTNLLIPVSGQTKKVWLMSAFNELFYVVFFTTLGILKGCVRFIGDSSKCDNYAYNMSVTSEEDMLRNFNYTRTTHPYEETLDNIDMVDSYDLFSISHAQLSLFRKGTKAPICVTIDETPKRGSTAQTPSSNAS